MNTTLFTQYHELEYKLNSFIDKKKFLDIKEVLDHRKWIKKEETCIVDKIFDDDIRKSKINDKNTNLIKKTRIHNKIFKINNDCLIKCSVSLEQPIDEYSTKNKIIKIIRKKQRFSYYTNHWKFDLSIINDTNYELELEFLDFHYIRNNCIEDLNNLALLEFKKLFHCSNR